MLLIGKGPLPSPADRDTGFPQLRTRDLWRALQGAGHEVRLVLLGEGEDSTQGGFSGTFFVSEEGPGWLERLFGLKADADVIVSAGPYNPGRAACLIAGDTPVWADLPGDPFAELQAVAISGEAAGETLAARANATAAAATAVLARADAIGVVSGRQRYAVLGQLGLLGRLPADGGERVFVVPVASDLDVPRGPPRAWAPGGPVTLALAGGFYTWLDDQTLAAGLGIAMAAEPGLRLVVTGGGIPGHATAGWARFRAWASGPALAARIDQRGRVPYGELGTALAPAHSGVILDRPGVEPELGSRTRALLFARLGLRIAMSPGGELGADLVARGEATPLPTSDPEGLAQAIRTLIAEGEDAARAAAAQAAIAARTAPEAVTAPLLAWVAAPTRTPPSPEAALAGEVARLRDELATVYASLTWRAMNGLHRWGSRALHGKAKGP